MAARSTGLFPREGFNLDAQLETERTLQVAAAQTADHKEGVAAFLEKRSPIFSGT